MKSCLVKAIKEIYSNEYIIFDKYVFESTIISVIDSVLTADPNTPVPAIQ